MAVTKGSAGVVKIGNLTVGEVTGYSLNHSVNLIDTTRMSSTAKHYLAGTKSFTGNLDVHWDRSDAGQAAITIGSSLFLNLYLEGTALDSIYFHGKAVVTGISITSGADTLVESVISVTGSGDLVEAVVIPFIGPTYSGGTISVPTGSTSTLTLSGDLTLAETLYAGYYEGEGAVPR